MSALNNNYKYTVYACYIGYIVQGIINNISPIFFVIYQKRLGISLDKIGMLIALNFGTQILTDIIAAKYVDRIGYRKSMIIAHISATIGIFGIGLFSLVFSNAFLGLVFATILNSIGGGLLEVLVSPIVESVPSKEKDKAMSMLHSFYCWGCVGFILISTLVLKFIGESYWYFIPFMWAIIPFINIFMFSYVPINTLVEEDERVSIKFFFEKKIFWIIVIMMICAGASELGMSQWASYFAEIGLGVNKTVGDIMGPVFFSIMMGLTRLFYGKKGEVVNLEKFICISCLLCVLSYIMAAFSPYPIIGLLGCGLCGLSVGILWPGMFSIAAKNCKEGGTALFAILAFAGDMGCVAGPQTVNIISSMFTDYGIKAGFMGAIVFPILMIVLMIFSIKNNIFSYNKKNT